MRILKINSLPSVKEAPWQDRDYIMVHASFQILVDFVEKEDGLNVWGNSEAVDLKGLYDWWKNIEPEYDLVCDEAQEKLELLIKNRRLLWT
jgi:hypothetical protein